MLRISNVKKVLGKKEILKGISAELNTGIVGLLGANGAGRLPISMKKIPVSYVGP